MNFIFIYILLLTYLITLIEALPCRSPFALVPRTDINNYPKPFSVNQYLTVNDGACSPPLPFPSPECFTFDDFFIDNTDDIT